MRTLEFRGPLGGGAHADVWQALDPVLQREVAVKVFRVSCAGTDEVLAHARALARVRHANVVAVHEIAEVLPPGATSPMLGVVMELVEGTTLDSRLRRGKFSRSEVQVFGLGILSGLAAMHAAGVVHGDLHRENVLLGQDGRARIIDVSLYRGTLSVLGTASRDELLTRDVRNAVSLLEDLTTYSDLDPDAFYRIRKLSRGSLDLAVVQGAFEEGLADPRLVAEPSQVLTAPTPDVRVTTGAGSTFGPPNPGLHFLAVTVANHSPVRVYLQSLLLPLPENRLLGPQVDAVYRRQIIAPVIEPGDSWQVPLDAEEIASAVRGDLNLIESILVTDKIGREYRANGAEVRAKLREVLSRIESERSEPEAQATKAAAPTEFEQEALDFIVGEHLRTCAPVTGLAVLTRLRSPSHDRRSVEAAVDHWVPRCLTRGNVRPHDQYVPTLRGLLASSHGPRVRAFVKRVLDYWRRAVEADPDHAVISSLHEDFAGFELPFMSAVTTIARLGGGGKGGGRDQPFELGIPYRMVDLLECETAESVAELWDE